MTPDEVRAYRQALGLTQEQLAAAFGTSQNTVMRWETGRRAFSPAAVLRLAFEALATRQGATGNDSRK